MALKEAELATGDGHIGDTEQMSLILDERARKHAKIEDAIKECDVVRLRAMACDDGGFLNDELRRQAWPILLGIEQTSVLKESTEDEIKSHTSYEQVVLDVNRSIKRFPPSIPTESRLNLQDKLVKVIMRVLVANPQLHYYQGYHDICVTILLVVNGDENLAFQIIEKVSRVKLRVYMEASMKATAEQLEFVCILVDTQDPELGKFLELSQCGIMFCVPWCITWFGHDLDHYPSLVRLYDLFLAIEDDPHLMPVYLTASLVLSHSKMLQLEECSMASVHSYLSKVPSTINFENGELEKHVTFARKLAAYFPVNELRAIQAKNQARAELEQQWRESLLGMTFSQLRSMSWNKRVFGAVIIVTVAIAYQVYRKRSLPTSER